MSGRGGQSALRFARLRMEKRHNYVRKVAETAVQLFVSNDKVNVAGLVLAGSADFKTELSQSDMFDPVRFRLLPEFNSDLTLGALLLAPEKVVFFGSFTKASSRMCFFF